MPINNMQTFDRQAVNVVPSVSAMSDEDYDADDGLKELLERLYSMFHATLQGRSKETKRSEGDFHPSVVGIHNRLDVFEAAMQGDELAFDMISEKWGSDEGIKEIILLLPEHGPVCLEVNALWVALVTAIKQRHENYLGIYAADRPGASQSV